MAPEPPAPPVARLPVKVQKLMSIRVGPAAVLESSKAPPLPLPPTRPEWPAPPVAWLSETVLWLRRALLLSPNKIEIERLVGLPLPVALDFDGERLGRLAGANVNVRDVVVVVGRRGAVGGAVRHANRLVVRVRRPNAGAVPGR